MTSNTDFITTASLFQYLHMGELVIFSICLLMLKARSRSVNIWVFSNAVAFFGSLFTLQSIFSGTYLTNALGGAIIIGSSALKALSFSDRGFARKSNQTPTVFLIIGLVLAAPILIFAETKFRLFLVAISGISLSISAIFYLLNNKM